MDTLSCGGIILSDESVHKFTSCGMYE
jgi:hypothetical protein